MKKSQLIEIIKEEIKDLLRENPELLVFKPLITEIKRILGNPSESLIKVHFFKSQRTDLEYISIDFDEAGEEYIYNLKDKEGKPVYASDLNRQLQMAVRNDSTAKLFKKGGYSAKGGFKTGNYMSWQLKEDWRRMEPRPVEQPPQRPRH